MSISVKLKGKRILRVSNMIFSLLHETLREIIEINKVPVSEEICRFLEETDQDIFGYGIPSNKDICKYFTTRHEALTFADLIKKSINLKYNNYMRIDGCIEVLEKFHEEIVNFANTLP